MEDYVNMVSRMPTAHELLEQQHQACLPHAPAPTPPPNACVMPPHANGTTARAAAPFAQMYDGPSMSSLSPADAERDREYTRRLLEGGEHDRHTPETDYDTRPAWDPGEAPIEAIP